MKKLLFIPVLFFCICSTAQDVSLALQKTPVFDPVLQATLWGSMKNNVQVSFANSNTRYAQAVFPEIEQQNNCTLTAWKGEKVHTQIIVWGKKNAASVNAAVTDFRSKEGKVISENNITTGFVGYVITDEFKNGCGNRKPENFDSSMVADPINSMVSSAVLKENTVQPLWVSIHIPANTSAGNYTGTITVKADKSYHLKLTIKVLNKTLPPPAKWKFNLDFWQHPAAIARVHSVKLWSEEHFSLMKKYYTMLANAGQKNICTNTYLLPQSV